MTSQLTATVLRFVLPFTVLGWSPNAAAQEPNEPQRLTLAEAVTRALETHPRVGAARAGSAAAHAGVGDAMAAWFPAVSFEASVTRFEEPMVTTPIHELNVGSFPTFDRTLIGGRAVAGYTIFEGGARGATVRGARADARAAAAEHETARLGLIAQVATVFLNVVTTHGVLEARDRQIVALTAERDRVNQLLAEGTAARVDALRVEASLAQAEADRITVAATLELAQLALARLIDAAPDETQPSRLVNVALRDTTPELNRTTLLEQTFAHNAQLRQAREALAAAEARNTVARAQWFPRLELFGGLLGFGYPDGFTTEWQVGARMAYPVFTGGRRSSAVQRASALAMVAREQVRLTELATEDELDRALTAVRQSRAREAATRRAVDHFAEVARIERLALDQGAGTQTDYLRAEAQLYGARASLIESTHSAIAARVELARIVGELSPAWLATALENTQ